MVFIHKGKNVKNPKAKIRIWVRNLGYPNAYSMEFKSLDEKYLDLFSGTKVEHSFCILYSGKLLVSHCFTP